MSDAQQASVDVGVAATGPSELDTDHVVQKGGGTPLDKPQMFSFPGTKSIELFQVAKDKLEIAPVPKFSNDGNGFQAVSSSSATKEEKSFTFEVSASAAGQTVLQNISFSKVAFFFKKFVSLHFACFISKDVLTFITLFFHDLFFS